MKSMGKRTVQVEKELKQKKAVTSHYWFSRNTESQVMVYRSIGGEIASRPTDVVVNTASMLYYLERGGDSRAPGAEQDNERGRPRSPTAPASAGQEHPAPWRRAGRGLASSSRR